MLFLKSAIRTMFFHIKHIAHSVLLEYFLPLYFRVFAFSIQLTQLSHHYQVRAETKKFSKCVSNSHISISFLFIWNRNDKYVHPCTLPQFPRKPYPIPHQNEQSVFRPKRPKTPTRPLYKGVPPLILTPFMIVRDQDKV